MEFIKMTRKGNVKVREGGKVVKLYAVPAHWCEGCVASSSVCDTRVCYAHNRPDRTEVSFQREKPQ